MAQKVFSLRSQRDADADLLRAACHLVGKQTVEADAGKAKGKQPKEAGEAGDKALVDEELVNLLGLGPDVEKWQVVGEFAHRSADGWYEQRGIPSGTQLEVHPASFERSVRDGLDFFSQVIVPGVADDTDDLWLGILRARSPEMEA
jgi:hypothetical protein